MKKRIGFDLDGVIFDYTQALRDEDPNLGCDNGPFTYAMIEDNWFTSREQWREVHDKAMKKADKFALIDTTIFDAIDLIHENGDTVVAATAREFAYEDLTRKALENNGLDFDELIVTEYATPKSKLGLAALLEDHPDTVLEPGETKMFVRNQPYNRHVPVKIPRVYTCLEYVESFYRPCKKKTLVV